MALVSYSVHYTWKVSKNTFSGPNTRKYRLEITKNCPYLDNFHAVMRLITNCDRCHYKMRQLFYCKTWQVYDKIRQLFYYTSRQFYYKMQQLWQNATFFTKYIGTMSRKNVLQFSEYDCCFPVNYCQMWI